MCQPQQQYQEQYPHPQGLATAATKNRVSEQHEKVSKKERSIDKTQQEMKKVMKKVSGKSFTISAKANDQGKLFAAIKPSQITELLVGEGYGVSEKMIKIEGEIKTIGEHTVGINFGEVGESKIKLQIETKS